MREQIVSTTVVVPTFNSEASLATTLESILAQSSLPAQVIIVDGQSQDGTLSVARRYLRKVDRIISEIDGGPYDAMNKGIQHAETDIVAILNSDDYWMPGTLQLVEDAFRKHPMVDIVHGNIEYIAHATPIKLIKPTFGVWRWLGLGLPAVHPATFIRRRVYDSIGLYDFAQFPICADQNFIYRAAAARVRELYIDRVLTVMRAGGLSSRTDLTAEIDSLALAFPACRRRLATFVRRILDSENRFYDGRVSSGFGKVILRRLYNKYCLGR